MKIIIRSLESYVYGLSSIDMFRFKKPSLGIHKIKNEINTGDLRLDPMNIKITLMNIYIYTIIDEFFSFLYREKYCIKKHC